MLFTGEDILSRFKQHLERATRVRIATAWATQGEQLDALGTAVQGNELKVRAIVGTYGNVTEPSALECLHEFGELRLVEGAPLFHPKIYVFEFGSGKPVAWVGSANFTRAGFENRNVETVYETKDVNPSLEWFEQQWGQSKRASQRVIDDYRERRRRNPPSREFQKFVGESESAAPEPLLPPEAQTWDPVLDPEEIRAAFDRMRATLIDDADELDRRVGYLSTVYWRDDPGYWCAFGRRRHGHWIPFGPENPEKSTQLGSGCLQINPPFDGNSEYAGIYAGLFVRNDSGDIFLARNLNKIPGVNKEDLERRLNESLPGRIFNFPWRRRTRRMVVLGEVGSGELRHAVAELVRLVAELRAAGTGAGEAP